MSSQVAPHKCPRCGKPAYLGFNVPARCSSPFCAFYDEQIGDEYTEEVTQALRADFDNEDTQPQGFSIYEEINRELDEALVKMNELIDKGIPPLPAPVTRIGRTHWLVDPHTVTGDDMKESLKKGRDLILNDVWKDPFDSTLD
jgi:hypothetical protein